MAIEEGSTIGLALRFHSEVVELRAIVRWRREAGTSSDEVSELPFWEVGLAFIAVGEVDPEGMWRGLRVYAE